MSFLNSLLLTLIKALHTLINNYALTIIVFTILIKLVVMPLNLKSRRSTMRMSTIQPKAAALQAKYKDDQEKLNQKLQELYRQKQDVEAQLEQEMARWEELSLQLEE